MAESSLPLLFAPEQHRVNDTSCLVLKPAVPATITLGVFQVVHDVRGVDTIAGQLFIDLI